jgi:hypothetical protein
MANLVSEEAREAYGKLMSSRPVIFETMREETLNVAENMATMDALGKHSLGAMPLVVLSAGRQMEESQAKMLQRAGVPAKDLQEYEAVFDQLHEELVALSSAGRRVTVKKSGHHIQLDQPDLVVEAIRQVVEAVSVVETNS